MYSPPDPPGSRARRTVVAGVVLGGLTLTTATATAVVLTVGPDTPPQPDRSPLRAMARPTSDPATRPATFATVPAPCAILPATAVRRLVPTTKPAVERMGDGETGTCRYSLSTGGRYHSVLVDSRAFLPRYLSGAAVAMTAWSFDAQWRQASRDPGPPRRLGGLGDAAFERYWIDPVAGVAVGEATVRYRNVLLRIQYAERRPSAAQRTASEERCLSAAVSAARTGLAAYG